MRLRLNDDSAGRGAQCNTNGRLRSPSLCKPKVEDERADGADHAGDRDHGNKCVQFDMHRESYVANNRRVGRRLAVASELLVAEPIESLLG